jgi:hypothetical protein
MRLFYLRIANFGHIHLFITKFMSGQFLKTFIPLSFLPPTYITICIFHLVGMSGHTPLFTSLCKFLLFYAILPLFIN